MADVGAARVEVTGDVRNFARDTERDLDDALSRIDLDPIKVEADSESARTSGRDAGRALIDSASEETRQGKGRISAALKGAFTPSPGLFDALRAPFAAALSSPIGAAMITVAGTAALAFIGAFTAALATAGLGAAFLGLGVAAAISTGKLDSSLKKLGETLKKVGQEASKPLIAPLEAAIDTLEKAVIRIGPILSKIFEGLAPAIGPLTEGMTGFVEQFLKVLTADPATLEAMKDALIALGANLPRLGEALGKVFALFASNENNVRNIGLLFGLLEQAFYTAASGVVALALVLDGLVIAWNAVKDAGAAAIGWITGTAIPAITGAAQSIGAFFASIPGIISSAWSAVTTFFSNAFTTISTFISNLVTSIVGFFTALPGRIIGALAALPAILGGFFSSMISNIAFLIGFGIGTIVSFFMNLPGRILGAIRALPGLVAGVFSAVWNTARSIVSSGISAVVSFFAQLPCRARSAISSLVSIVSSVFSSAASAARTQASSLVSGAIGIISRLPGQIRSALSSVRSAVTGAFSGAAGWLVSAGYNIIAGVKRGIASAISGAVGAAQSAARQIVAGFKSALKIGSPSRVAETEIGRWIPAGIAQGVERNMGVVDKAVRKLAPDALESDFGFTIPTGRVRGGDGASLSGAVQVTFGPGSIVINSATRAAGEAAAEGLLERLAQATLVR